MNDTPQPGTGIFTGPSDDTFKPIESTENQGVNQPEVTDNGPDVPSQNALDLNNYNESLHPSKETVIDNAGSNLADTPSFIVATNKEGKSEDKHKEIVDPYIKDNEKIINTTPVVEEVETEEQKRIKEIEKSREENVKELISGGARRVEEGSQKFTSDQEARLQVTKRQIDAARKEMEAALGNSDKDETTVIPPTVIHTEDTENNTTININNINIEINNLLNGRSFDMLTPEEKNKYIQLLEDHRNISSTIINNTTNITNITNTSDKDETVIIPTPVVTPPTPIVTPPPVSIVPPKEEDKTEEDENKEQEDMIEEAKKRERERKGLIAAGVTTGVIGTALVGTPFVAPAIIGATVATVGLTITEKIGAKRVNVLAEKLKNAQTPEEKAKYQRRIEGWNKFFKASQKVKEFLGGFMAGAGLTGLVSGAFFGGRGLLTPRPTVIGGSIGRAPAPQQTTSTGTTPAVEAAPVTPGTEYMYTVQSGDSMPRLVQEAARMAGKDPLAAERLLYQQPNLDTTFRGMLGVNNPLGNTVGGAQGGIGSQVNLESMVNYLKSANIP